MKHLLLLSPLLLAACSAQAPQVAADKGAVYGVLAADANSVVKEKYRRLNASADAGSPYGTTPEGGIVYKEDMVNYAALDDLYVGLVVPVLSPQQHAVHAGTQGISPRAIALAVGDMLRIYNDTGRRQAFFISQTPDSGDEIQGLPSIAAGGSANYSVQLAGNLELLSEDDANLKASLFSKKNMLAQRVASGGTYQFENLNPGQYPLFFWYWRLGKIEQRVDVKAGESVRVDKTLSVDNIMKAQ